jgi:hypothetical protein
LKEIKSFVEVSEFLELVFEVIIIVALGRCVEAKVSLGILMVKKQTNTDGRYNKE